MSNPSEETRKEEEARDGSVLLSLAQVVLEMRRAQKNYFRLRTKEALIASKTLEAAVDVRLGMLGFKP